MHAATHQQNPTHYDAIIIGASIAGAVCALELAEKNWRIAVIEKRSDPAHYKKVCTHIIHPSGVETLRRLGLVQSLQNRSMQNTAMELHFGNRSAYYPFGGKREAANIERRDLDPFLKQKLETTPGITLFSGGRLSQISAHNKRVEGVEIETAQGSKTLSCSLLIGADGRQSETVGLAKGQTYQDKNHRVALFAYYEKASAHETSQVWALQRGDEYLGYFPNNTRALVSWYISEEAYQEIKHDKVRAFTALEERLADKGIKLGKQLELPAVAKQTAPVRATTSLQSLALVGDAKLAADPLTGVGCSWAMGSAELLARCLPELRQGATQDQNKRETIKGLSGRLALYSVLHACKYRLPSAAMTFASKHGHWFYNRGVFPLLARITR